MSHLFEWGWCLTVSFQCYKCDDNTTLSSQGLPVYQKLSKHCSSSEIFNSNFPYAPLPLNFMAAKTTVIFTVFMFWSNSWNNSPKQSIYSLESRLLHIVCLHRIKISVQLSSSPFLRSRLNCTRSQVLNLKSCQRIVAKDIVEILRKVEY